MADKKSDKKAEDLLRRPLYVYDLPPEVLVSLTPKDVTDAHALVPLAPSRAAAKDKSPGASSENLVGSQSCSLCGLDFAALLDQRSHLKSDLHHYNLKQKLRGQRPVTEAEFEKLLGNLDESLSGSDSPDSEDDEDEKKDTTLTALLRKQATLAERQRSSGADNDDEDENWTKKGRGQAKSPLLWFSSPLLPENTYFGVHRAIFTSKELEDEEKIVETIQKRQLDPVAAPKPAKDGSLPPIAYKGPHIFLCMMGGGHFAAMVVSLAPRQTKGSTTGPMSREATVLAHKTFHRYTTRRKQGGSQSANDNSKGTAHSAGSSLRRYNEQALVEDIRTLLADWKALLDTSELLFIRATGNTNRGALFGPHEDQVLRANDPRIRGFPFSTRRATQSELMQAFIKLTRLQVQEITPVQKKASEADASTPSKPAASKPSKPKPTEEEETAQLHTTQIQALIRRSKLPALLSYLKSNSLSPDFAFHPPEQNYHAPMPLHLAAAQNAAPLIVGLLSRGGADPTKRNADGKTPFELAGDRATRDAFRVARSEMGEEQWDWEAAQVPGAMSKAEADKREGRERVEAERKESERKRAEEERLRAEGKAGEGAKQKKGQSLFGAAQTRGGSDDSAAMAGMSPEMRMKFERERRAKAAEERIRKMQAGK